MLSHGRQVTRLHPVLVPCTQQTRWHERTHDVRMMRSDTFSSSGNVQGPHLLSPTTYTLRLVTKTLSVYWLAHDTLVGIVSAFYIHWAWVWLQFAMLYWVRIPSVTEWEYWVLLSVTECYWVRILSVTECYWVRIPSVTECYWYHPTSSNFFTSNSVSSNICPISSKSDFWLIIQCSRNNFKTATLLRVGARLNLQCSIQQRWRVVF